eukprot:365011-Chlamydomonas_euryale.AAC.27
MRCATGAVSRADFCRRQGLAHKVFAVSGVVRARWHASVVRHERRLHLAVARRAAVFVEWCDKWAVELRDGLAPEALARRLPAGDVVLPGPGRLAEAAAL